MSSKTKTAVIACAAALGGLLVGQAAPVQAQLGGLLKGAAVLVAVKQFAGPINSFVNTLTGNKPGSESGQATKVVPILSLGRGTYAGLVQVSGPQAEIDRVGAVAQVQGETRVIGQSVRATGLVPISDTKVENIGSLSRVKGVGVSAIIDLKL